MVSHEIIYAQYTEDKQEDRRIDRKEEHKPPPAEKYRLYEQRQL